jgi:hypothetical protein
MTLVKTSLFFSGNDLSGVLAHYEKRWSCQTRIKRKGRPDNKESSGKQSPTLKKEQAAHGLCKQESPSQRLCGIAAKHPLKLERYTFQIRRCDDHPIENEVRHE